MNEKLTKLLENRDFVEKILNMKTDEEVKNEFKSNGVDLTDEEILEIKKAYSQMAEKLEKLDDNTLEKLSGGWGGKSKKEEAIDAIWEFISKNVSTIGKGILGFFGCVEARKAESEAVARKNQVISNSVIMLDVVALSTLAGLIYSKRRAIKRWWNSSSSNLPLETQN